MALHQFRDLMLLISRTVKSEKGPISAPLPREGMDGSDRHSNGSGHIVFSARVHLLNTNLLVDIRNSTTSTVSADQPWSIAFYLVPSGPVRVNF
ncbi:hypothetical protein DPEC_G00036390, partial [Dallia pectoralis]